MVVVDVDHKQKLFGIDTQGSAETIKIAAAAEFKTTEGKIEAKISGLEFAGTAELDTKFAQTKAEGSVTIGEAHAQIDYKIENGKLHFNLDIGVKKIDAEGSGSIRVNKQEIIDYVKNKH